MKPSIGRIVHYHPGPNDPEGVQSNHSPALPAVIVRVFSDTCVNLRILCDGPDVAWKTSVCQGDGEYQWSWPERV